ncbi:predicted protein [Histoplasma mississippiense (nom. inval.)]|uniref:predicted protein n=1 Tax=Ajellomyces capsulatus (strain NAm1 / WU24) TaxID=2059318 RepID=UPI000157CFB2|nr:predicted protein [Histoplasma mississippiense (nom. inval.)]EDN11195.1 predicted protein [Histoplasma mississippiense (nom. inval.)]
MEIHPRKIFDRRPLHWRFKPMPETAFVVPTVIEDLKYRWSPEEVVRCTASAPELQNAIAACGDYGISGGACGSIFAGRTQVVPGEADQFCAIAARETGCAVLTGDSDLLVHDLGAEGSVIFIDSIETGDPLPNYKPAGAGAGPGPGPDIASIFSIRATQVRPATVAKKLGVPSFQRLAYELNRDSHASFPTIIQRAKGSDSLGIVAKSANYIAFMKEYDLGGHAAADSCAWISNTLTAIADPRLSELYAQYELPAFAVPGEAANVYLHDLIEHHDRRTAWTQGSEFRLIAYSLLNQRYATGGAQGRRKEAVIEHMRKGQRIAPVLFALLGRREVEERLEAFLQQVNLFVSAVYNDDAGGGGGGDGDDGNGVCGGSARDPTALWRAFALYDILARMAPDERPSVGQLRRFLERGYCGEKLEWDDIHLHAQRKAVLYSLRMLKDVLAASGEMPEPMLDEGLAALISEATGLLGDLPWLRDCHQRTCGIGGDEGGEGPRRVVEGLVLLLKEEGEGEGGQELGGSLVEGPGLLGASSHHQGDRGQLNNASTAGAGEGWIGASKLPSSRKGKKRRRRTASKGAAHEKAPTTAKHAMNIYDILRQVD